MEFCEDCNNMLIPKDGELYCKACEEYYPMTEGEANSTKKIIQKEEEYGKTEGRIESGESFSKKNGARFSKLLQEESDKRRYDLKFDE